MSDTQNNYVEMLNHIFKRREDMMPFAVPEGSEGKAIIVLFEGVNYRISFDESQPLKPLIMRYTGFGMAESLVASRGPDYDVREMFYAEMKRGLHDYIYKVLQTLNAEHMPEPLIKYYFRNRKVFLKMDDAA